MSLSEFPYTPRNSKEPDLLYPGNWQKAKVSEYVALPDGSAQEMPLDVRENLVEKHIFTSGVNAFDSERDTIRLYVPGEVLASR